MYILWSSKYVFQLIFDLCWYDKNEKNNITKYVCTKPLYKMHLFHRIYFRTVGLLTYNTGYIHTSDTQSKWNSREIYHKDKCHTIFFFEITKMTFSPQGGISKKKSFRCTHHLWLKYYMSKMGGRLWFVGS